jgi:hypothetical protein
MLVRHFYKFYSKINSIWFFDYLAQLNHSAKPLHQLLPVKNFRLF